MWRNHPSCIRSWSVLLTFKSSESSKEVHPGSIAAFGYASLCCYRERKAKCTELFSSSPYHGQFFRPLNLIIISVPIIRRRNVTSPSFPQPYSWRRDPTGWPCWAPCCPHQIPEWLNDRYSPAAVIKWEPFTQDRRCESSISVRARHRHRSCFASS
jgi:hypothetical protein